MNKYEVLGVVGEGAYGVVLKCQNRETSEISKFSLTYSYLFHPTRSSNQEVQRFRRRWERAKKHS